MNLANILERSTQFFASNPAIREGDLEWTYAELNTRANRVATALISMGVKPGDLIGLSAPNSAYWIAFYYGVIKAGASAVTLFSTITSQELKNLLNHSKPKFLFTTPDRIPDLKPLQESGILEKIICTTDSEFTINDLMDKGRDNFKAIDMQRDDVAAVLYTGGTTGIPKGVMLMHEGILFSSQAIAIYEHSTPQDLALCLNPMNHVFGQIHIMNATIFSAGCLELLPVSDIEKILSLMERGRVTKFFQVPTMYVRLLNVPDIKKRLGNVSYCFSAAAVMAKEIVLRWRETTGLTIAESLGMTEAMPISFNHYYPERHLIGSVGQPVCGVEVQIRNTETGELMKPGEEGEICIRGRNVMKGYLNNPEETKNAFYEGGWLRSGDIGFLDENEYLYIIDRLKELIITGGENVFPHEVEETIFTIPEVAECAVVGVPDNEWGERVTAFIIPKVGRTIDPDKVKAYLKTKLAPFKVPKDYICVEDMPKTPAGKIMKRELRRQFIANSK